MLDAAENNAVRVNLNSKIMSQTATNRNSPQSWKDKEKKGIQLTVL